MKKIMDRVYNVEKSRKRAAQDSIDDAIPRKRGRPKRVINLASRYPPLQPSTSDPAQEQHMQAIVKEMEKEKPRKDILLPLMKSTFYVRRQHILDSEETVTTKLERFPALRMPPVVRNNSYYTTATDLFTGHTVKTLYLDSQGYFWSQTMLCCVISPL